MTATVLRISVVCPVYNTPAGLLHAAAQSVLAAAGPHLHELLLVDDASTRQETLAAIEQIAAADARVVVVRQRRNGGPGAARNEGIRQARGDWIGFIDSDDLWLPGRMEAVLSVLQSFPEAEWIAGNYESLYHDGTIEAAPLISRTCPGKRLGEDLFLLHDSELTRCLISNFWIHVCASIIKLAAIQRIGVPFDERLYYYEDCIFLAKFSLIARCYFLEREYYSYRRDAVSLTSSPRRLTDAYAAGWRRAQRDKLFQGFRREIRWALYGIYKGLAINNLSNALPGSALWFALRAWLLDPREVGELALFLRLLLRGNSGRSVAEERRYSAAERFVIDQPTLRAKADK